MTLQQIKYFKEVAKTLNFSRAAENLYVAQPSLSHAIRELENELGVPLFLRSGNKKTVLTQYGTMLLSYANIAIKALDDAKSAIIQMQNPAYGKVSLGYAYVTGYNIVAAFFRDFYQENDPDNIQVVFRIDHNSERTLIKSLLTGELDLAIAGPIASPESDVRFAKISDQQLYVIMSANHPLATRKKLTIEDIKDEPFIAPGAGTNFTAYLGSIYEAHGCKPSITDYMPNWTSRILYASLGHGITICPHLNFDSGKVSAIKLDDPMARRPIYLIWPTNRPMTPPAEYVRDFLINHYAKSQEAASSNAEEIRDNDSDNKRERERERERDSGQK